MNKKVLGVFVSLLAVAMLATPVKAEPTQGQKVAVTLSFVGVTGPPEIVDTMDSGPVSHRLVHTTWVVVLEIENGPTFSGTAFDERTIVIVPQKDGTKQITKSHYEFSFPSEGGGFEGNTLLILDGFTGPPPPLWEKGKAYSLFQGTGAFEGQTLNFRHTWSPYVAGPIVWDGYLLKP
jgi:hypothetical protein